MVPDSNVVIDMIDAADSQDSQKATRARDRLQPLTSFLRSCSENGLRYHISPFFGLNEMRNDSAGPGVASLDSFSSRFGLHWVDAHPEHDVSQMIVGILTRGFRELEAELQCVLAPPYCALLLMLVVARDLPSASPLARFRHFLRLYRRLIDVISIREITIARFAFAPEPVEEGSLYPTWSRILLNFTKRQKLSQRWPTTASQLDKAALNGAFDLFLLNSALLSDYKGLQGERLDTWILTADAKLAALTDAVHHTDMGTGKTGLFCVTQDYRDQGDYWRETHHDMQALNTRFRPWLKTSVVQQRARAISIMALAEQGLHGRQPPQGMTLRFSGDPKIGHQRIGVLIPPPFS
ncbi:hypothetical protein CSC75_05720 [Pseudoxanthomonas wuyuanensis]|nr:hypothetical protein CSC75_05720 [Pseudoxanthomonas wuyuanensis]